MELFHKTTEIQEKYPGILDEFSKYYVFFHKNPAYTEYQQIYESNKSNIQQLMNELHENENQLVKNRETLNERLSTIDEKITREKEKTPLLKKKVIRVKNQDHASDILFQDTKTKIQEITIKNILLGVGIFISGVSLYRIS